MKRIKYAHLGIFYLYEISHNKITILLTKIKILGKIVDILSKGA